MLSAGNISQLLRRRSSSEGGEGASGKDGGGSVGGSSGGGACGGGTGGFGDGSGGFAGGRGGGGGGGRGGRSSVPSSEGCQVLRHGTDSEPPPCLTIGNQTYRPLSGSDSVSGSQRSAT